MILDRVSMKAQAKQELSDKWRDVIIVAIIMVVVSVLSSITHTETVYVRDYGYMEVTSTTWISSLIRLLAAPVFAVGFARYFMNIVSYRAYDRRDVFAGFSNYGPVLGSMLWVSLFTYLWSLLFIVPGIIKSIAYSQTKYILAENPRVGFREAIKISMVLTDGRKGELFSLYISFFGWLLLTAITFGLAGLYTLPYIETTCVHAYEALKAAAIAEGRITADVFAPESTYNVQ